MQSSRTYKEHKECPIHFHHCGGKHVDTGYKCPLIEYYRLRKQPEKHPLDVQLFIPLEYRNSSDRTKTIFDKRAYQQQQQHLNYNINDQKAWPKVLHSTPALNQNINEIIQSLDSLNARDGITFFQLLGSISPQILDKR
ncbi:unnamed protein product [Didymodactylos carnosus]|uniref:Uncharacterized protein n=1 Tax=Didymodactylos carnosus TaxID=1234261 RepID=A0A814VGG5_9BILA|nr:unnamed protein product [Didymodactylos carnosus]CAF1247981.1 unnamed protein product [Didymodactylos carnosus]CAF3951298.1 unnamed protein product [Didymodactylos carnosus]CAF4055635.1 unnamed protein product [Didymodactylos carnosus]